MKRYFNFMVVGLLILSIMSSVLSCSGDKSKTENKSESVSTSADVYVPKEKQTLEFWHAMNGENGEILETLVKKFNETHQNIEVKPVFQGHYRELFEKLNGAAQANSLPALSMIYCNRLTAYVLNDLVENLNPRIDDPKYGFDKKIWNDIPAGLRDNGMWNGIHHSLPFNKGAYLMYYNEDVLKERGIAVPKTWDELKSAAKKLTGDGKIGLVFNKSVGVDFSFWVEQAGGHIYDEEKDVVLIDTPEVKEAYEFILSMINDKTAKIEFEEGYITGPMSRGEAFIGFASSSNLPKMKEACAATGINWKVAELPKGKKAAALYSGTDITMFNTVSEETKRAAFEFMKFWFETDTQIAWGKKSGYLPLTNAALNSKEFQAFLDNEDPSKRIASNMFPYAYQDPKGLNGYAIHSNMQKALEEVVAGKKTLDQALKDAQENATREREEAKKNFQKK